MYNGERYIGASIESVLDQTLGDFELIIADNASTDATGVICKEYAESDDRIRVVRNPVNVGLRRNFHLVLELSGPSEYFKWHGHDDMLAPEFLERCVAHLDAHPTAALCGTGIRVVDGDGRPLGPDVQPIAFCAATAHERLRAFYSHPRVHQTLFGVHRRRVLASTGLLGSWYSADRLLLMELALRGCFGQVDETLFISREHQDRGDYRPDKVDYYAPERNGRSDIAYWPHLRATARTLSTAPFPTPERARCAVELGRRAQSVAGTWARILPRELAAVAVNGVRRRLPERRS